MLPSMWPGLRVPRSTRSRHPGKFLEASEFTRVRSERVQAASVQDRRRSHLLATPSPPRPGALSRYGRHHPLPSPGHSPGCWVPSSQEVHDHDRLPTHTTATVARPLGTPAPWVRRGRGAAPSQPLVAEPHPGPPRLPHSQHFMAWQAVRWQRRGRIGGRATTAGLSCGSCAVQDRHRPNEHARSHVTRSWAASIASRRAACPGSHGVSVADGADRCLSSEQYHAN